MLCLTATFFLDDNEEENKLFQVNPHFLSTFYHDGRTGTMDYQLDSNANTNKQIKEKFIAVSFPLCSMIINGGEKFQLTPADKVNLSNTFII